MQFKDSKTAKNLIDSYKREADSSMKFSIYASVAQKEEYRQIASIFKNISENEMMHCKSFARYLHNDYKPEEILQGMTYSPMYFGTTRANVIEAANGELLNSNEIYSQYAQVAFEEKFPEIAALFNLVASVEERQSYLLIEMSKQLDDGEYFTKDEIVRWLCTECGYVYTGYSAPEYCPLCYKERRYFILFNEGCLES